MSLLGNALMLGGIGGAFDFGFNLLGGYLGNMIGASTSKELMKKQWKYQKDLMKTQNDYNVYNYQHQHQWRVADLRAAGLNPILSASGGSAVAPVSNPGVSSSGAGNPMGNSNSMSHMLRDVLALNSAKAESEIEANKAATFKALSEASATNSMASREAEKFKIMLPAIKKQAEYDSSTSRQWSRHVGDWTHALSPVFDLVPTAVLMRGVGKFLKGDSSSARGLNRDLKSAGYYDLEPSASKGYRWLHVDGDGGFRDSDDGGFTPLSRRKK